MSSDNRLDIGDDPKGYRWESEYEKTWEAICESEDGSLQSTIDELIVKAKRRKMRDKKNLRLGMMRYLYIVIDMSESMLEHDLKPTRIQSTLNLLKIFLNDFFDVNPISQVGIIVTRNKRGQKLSDLTAHPEPHLDAVNKLKELNCTGEPSLQNAIDIAIHTLKHMPSHSSKEILIIMGSLTSCDPTDITETIKTMKNHHIRCSIIGLAAEVKLCQAMAKDTQGSYDVILDEIHFKDLLRNQLKPPPANANSDSSLIRMGFPQYYNEGEGPPSMCTCHLNENGDLNTAGYFCPQCNSKYCQLPVECQVCALTLVSSSHLSRSYHHLFPIELFREIKSFKGGGEESCYSCQASIKSGAECNNCGENFCIDCDVFIHETLHVCPGCSSRN